MNFARSIDQFYFTFNHFFFLILYTWKHEAQIFQNSLDMYLYIVVKRLHFFFPIQNHPKLELMSLPINSGIVLKSRPARRVDPGLEPGRVSEKIRKEKTRYDTHYQKTRENQRNYRRNFSVGNYYRQK
jgi:hypothetical protein